MSQRHHRTGGKVYSASATANRRSSHGLTRRQERRHARRTAKNAFRATTSADA